MPELPEVETARRGIAGLLTGHTVAAVTVRDHRLRQPVSPRLGRTLTGQTLAAVGRRGKYLLLEFDAGTLILHLGMSGSLRVIAAAAPASKHDHIDILFGGDRCLRLRDPRRFGLAVWTRGPAALHPLLRDLGPEPWDPQFAADYLRARARGRTVAIKNFVMNNRVVVGVGNIYANEALYRAGIHPARPAGAVARARLAALVAAIRTVLEEALAAGGTSLRDFVRDDGRPGYFAQSLRVYQRAGEACECRRAVIHQTIIGQRSSFYCPRCQH